MEFERIKTEFYEEVVYAENGPGAEEYQKYYQTMDPTTAEYLYKQVVQQLETDARVEDYAQAYAEMEPAQPPLQNLFSFLSPGIHRTACFTHWHRRSCLNRFSSAGFCLALSQAASSFSTSTVNIVF